MSKCNEAEIKQALSEAFDHIDTDKSGHLDSKEIASVLTEFNNCSHCKKKKSAAEINADVQEFIKECDKNNDNKISKKEFLDFFIKLLA